jgi:signal transduction histidine kinase
MYLDSRTVGSVFVFRIRDDGRGFDASNPPTGMGITYLRQRAREVGAILDVISSPGSGTTVQMRFERRGEYLRGSGPGRRGAY